MAHPKKFSHGSIVDVAREAAHLDHRSRKEFLEAFAAAILEESDGDREAGKPKLAGLGLQLYMQLEDVLGTSEQIALLTEAHQRKSE